jgi:type IV pilus assembly protein PilW
MTASGNPTGMRSNAGFSLVELMVSLVISLIVLAAVSSVMVTSKRANTAETAQARMQDNARIAVQIMARDIRQAGYFGCSTGNGSNNFHNDLNNGNSGNPLLNLTVGMEGANGGDAAMSPLGDALPSGPNGAAYTNSDIISVRYADGAGALSVTPPYMTQASSALQIALPNTINQFDILMVSDCNGGDIFQVSNSNPQTAGTISHNSGVGSPGNSTGKLSRTYSGDATISKFVSNTYFVAKNNQGQPALYRLSPTSSGATHTDELVDGIDEIRILYGVDTNGDGSVDCYIKAGASCGSVDLSTAAGWSKVYSVRLGVLARTLANNTIRGDKASASSNTADLDTKSYDILGDGTYVVTPSGSDQQYQHHVFRTTIMVRNHPGT